MTKTKEKPAVAQVNDVENVATKFRNSLGNGKVAAQHWSTLINSVVSSRDTTVLAKQFKMVRDNEGDAHALRAMMVTIKAVWPNVKVKRNTKTGDHSILIKGIDADKAAIARMNEAVEKGLVLRDTYAKHVKGETEKTEKTFDVKAWAERQVKAHPDQVAAMKACLLYTSPSPRDGLLSRMPSSA